MAIDWWTHLLDACVAASAAIVFVLALRWPLRKLFGATLAYQAWLLVPILIGVALLPRMAVQHRPTVVAVIRASTELLAAPARHAGVHGVGALQALWCLGAVALALWFWRAHRSFVRGLGELTPAGRLFYSDSPASGPVLLGLWRPKIIVPSDFAQRYTEQEQALIIAHERVHARRADVFVNLLQAALQCLFWFNPLVHAAAVFFRADQEMACDAAVLRRHPGLLRSYAQALLKSQSLASAAPTTVACSWRFNHPVKERFMTLQNQPRAKRRLIGRVLVASMIAGGAYAGIAARASEPAAPGKPLYDIMILNMNESDAVTRVTADTIDQKAGEKSPHLIEAAGGQFGIEKGNWRAAFVITPVSALDKTYMIDVDLTSGDQHYHPRLMGKLGEKIAVSVGGADKRFDLALLVNEAAPRAQNPGQ
ncbi:hypothetical protein GCM10027321_07560 [Massilia terrae]|uniref:M56 family metallopeptidase n=1 Tax=Massilia terrae TaxID=1811224 RepID=A0ABT2D0C8_9BURK|nr:M56 family metallopeptidase [Massilia terrae]MCS0659671.1 M56 family metallopeptidase [Massilia terrae]